MAKNGFDELVAQFAALDPGTAVKFTHGEDFKVAPGTFRNHLHRRMRSMGWIIETVPRGESILAKLVRRVDEDGG